MHYRQYMHTQQHHTGCCHWPSTSPTRMSRAVFRILRRLIAFPTTDDLETVGAGFTQLDGSPTFHGVAGTIYSCHIRSEPPVNELSPAFVPDVVACCAVLHNLVCLQNRDIVDAEVVRIMKMTNLNPETQSQRRRECVGQSGHRCVLTRQLCAGSSRAWLPVRQFNRLRLQISSSSSHTAIV